MPSTTRPDAPRARARALPPPIHAPSPTVATLSSLLLISALACGGDDGVADTDGITTAGSSDPSAGPTDASATGSSGDDSAASMTDGALLQLLFQARQPATHRADPEHTIRRAMHGADRAGAETIALGIVDEGITGELAYPSEPGSDPHGP